MAKRMKIHAHCRRGNCCALKVLFNNVWMTLIFLGDPNLQTFSGKPLWTAINVEYKWLMKWLCVCCIFRYLTRRSSMAWFKKSRKKRKRKLRRKRRNDVTRTCLVLYVFYCKVRTVGLKRGSCVCFHFVYILLICCVETSLSTCCICRMLQQQMFIG